MKEDTATVLVEVNPSLRTRRECLGTEYLDLEQEYARGARFEYSQRQTFTSVYLAVDIQLHIKKVFSFHFTTLSSRGSLRQIQIFKTTLD